MLNNSLWQKNERQNHFSTRALYSLFMLWLKCILGLNVIFFCFKIIIIRVHVPKNKRKENLKQG